MSLRVQLDISASSNRLVTETLTLDYNFVEGFNVLAHVFVGFSNGSRRTGPATTALFVFFDDSLLVVMEWVPVSASLIADIDMGAKTHSIGTVVDSMYTLWLVELNILVGELTLSSS